MHALAKRCAHVTVSPEGKKKGERRSQKCLACSSRDGALPHRATDGSAMTPHRQAGGEGGRWGGEGRDLGRDWRGKKGWSGGGKGGGRRGGGG